MKTKADRINVAESERVTELLRKLELVEQNVEEARLETEDAKLETEAMKLETEAVKREIEAVKREAEAAEKEFEAAEQVAEAAKQEAEVAEQKAEVAEQKAEVAEQKARTMEKKAKTIKEQAQAIKEEAKAIKEESKAIKEESKAIKEEAKAIKQAVQHAKQKAQIAKQEAEDTKQEARAVKKELFALRQEARAVKQELQAAIEEGQAAIEEAQAVMRENEMIRRLSEGTFYASLNEVWTPVAMPFTESDFSDLIRQSCPKGDKYSNTFVAARNVNNVPVPEVKSRDEYYDNNYWARDIFGSDDLMDPGAHLIPMGSPHASMYDEVVTCALGLTAADLTPAKLGRAFRREPTNEDLSAAISEAIAEAKQKAIHGAQHRQWWHPSNLYCLMGIMRTGLKHSQSNKLRLRGQKQFLADNPCVVIVPIMTLDKTKNWDGKGYDAIVMAEAWDVDKHKISLKNVCRGIGMLDFGDQANTEEIELARQLLKNVLCGLAFSLINHDHSHLPPESLAIMDGLKSQFSKAIDDTHIYVPAASGRDSLRVRKITFGKGKGQHPPPDPFLLLVKAGVVWSRRNGQQLLAGGEEQDKDENEGSIIIDEDGGNDVPNLERYTRGQPCEADGLVSANLVSRTGGGSQLPQFV